MLINTRDFGELEVSEEELITFPAGLFAFEESRRFALISPLNTENEDVYPKWLQSADDIVPCFIVFDPIVADTNYTVQLETFDEKLLKLDGESVDNIDVSFLVIATVPQDFKKTTLNMKAPIVINQKDRIAAQVILQADYEFRLPLYPDEIEEAGAEGC